MDILGSDTRLLAEIRRELLEIRDQYGDKRRTTIMVDRLDLTSEDLIAQQDLVVTFSHQGYCKSQRVSEYRSQHRGGRGRSAARVKEEDFIERLFVANSHDTLLCFSNAGKVYWLNFEVLDAQRDLLAAEQQLVKTRRALLSSRISLYAALGGGSMDHVSIPARDTTGPERGRSAP